MAVDMRRYFYTPGDIFYEKEDRDDENSDRIIKNSGVTPYKTRKNWWWVKSQSRKDIRYKVHTFAKDEWACQCLEFAKRISRGQKAPCKHIKAVQKFIRRTT